MSDLEIFRAGLEQAVAEAPRTPNGIPLIGLDQLDLRDARAAALISALADIVEATCVRQALAAFEPHTSAA